jgi:hypothetical protein
MEGDIRRMVVQAHMLRVFVYGFSAQLNPSLLFSPPCLRFSLTVGRYPMLIWYIGLSTPHQTSILHNTKTSETIPGTTLYTQKRTPFQPSMPGYLNGRVSDFYTIAKSE